MNYSISRRNAPYFLTMDTPTPVPDSNMTPHAVGSEEEANGRHGTPNGSKDAHVQAKRVDLRRFGLDDTLATSYPTKSLEFLRRLDGASHETSGAQSAISAPFETRTRLKVVVIGAGLGGLAAAVALARSGHSVEVLEQAPALGEVRGLHPTTTQPGKKADEYAGWRWYPDTPQLGQAPPPVGRLQVS